VSSVPAVPEALAPLVEPSVAPVPLADAEPAVVPVLPCVLLVEVEVPESVSVPDPASVPSVPPSVSPVPSVAGLQPRATPKTSAIPLEHIPLMP
jgi:hypothetical protein